MVFDTNQLQRLIKREDVSGSIKQTAFSGRFYVTAAVTVGEGRDDGDGVVCVIVNRNVISEMDVQRRHLCERSTGK